MRNAKSCIGNASAPWTGLFRFMALISLALTLTACASLTTPSEARAPLPPSLTAPCQPLPLLADGMAGTVLRWAMEAIEAYQDCAERHRALVEAVR